MWKKILAAVGVIGMMGLAVASSGTIDIGSQLSESLYNTFCPIIRFIAGPLFWGVIGVLIMVGLIMMASASRGFGKYFLYPIVAAIIFAIVKGYITNQATQAGGSGVIQNCLNWQ